MANKLIYFGAGWDGKVVKSRLNRIKELGIQTFYYVDALPNLPHYTPEQAGYAKSQTTKSIVEALIEDLKPLKVVKTIYEEGRPVVHLFLRTGKRIHYYFNRTVEEFLANEEGRRIAADCTVLNICGFEPKLYGLRVLEHMPKLEWEITNLRVLNVKHWFKSGPTQSGPSVVPTGENRDGAMLYRSPDSEAYVMSAIVEPARKAIPGPLTLFDTELIAHLIKRGPSFDDNLQYVFEMEDFITNTADIRPAALRGSILDQHMHLQE